MVRAGHPWVFRDSLARPAEGLSPDTPVRLDDPDGYTLGWGLFDPEGAIAVRVISRREELSFGATAVEERIRAAVSYRETALGDVSRQCRRLVHAEGDGLPGFAVDRLGEFLLVYKYGRVADVFFDDAVAALERIVEPRGIYLQDRTRPVSPDEPKPPAALIAGTAAPPELTIEEEGLHYIVDVTAPVSPGLFIDLREGRRWCEELAGGRRVLNLFSFTGAFALRALRGGAQAVTNVDAAARSHARCRQNLAASGLDPEACEGLTGDAFAHIERLRRKDREFDLAIVDPPPFSRVKDRVFSALRDWAELIEEVSSVVVAGGHLLVVSNAVQLSDVEFMTAIGQGGARAGRRVSLVGERGLPPDFPVPPAFSEGRYLKIRLLHVV